MNRKEVLELFCDLLKNAIIEGGSEDYEGWERKAYVDHKQLMKNIEAELEDEKSKTSSAPFRRLTNAEANKIYRALVNHCLANPDLLNEFLQCVADHNRGNPYHASGDFEYRFMGNLGYGGKFHWDGTNATVSCYGEDVTPERQKMIKNAVEAITLILKEKT